MRTTATAIATATTIVFAMTGLTSAAQELGKRPPATLAGAEACRACHEELSARYEKNVHAGAAATRRMPERTGCEACHGSGAAHAEEPSNRSGLVTFSAGAEGASIAACLACHSTDSGVGDFDLAQHGRHEVACNECHSSPHAERALSLRRSPFAGEESAPEPGNHLRKDSVELCLECHSELRGRFSMPYRHPVREKALGCVSCHNPHRDQSRDARATNAICFLCHEDKRGPWPFEHAPVAEDCSSCHDAHGSVAPRLLKTAEPFLCLSCHALPDDRHGVEIGGTRFSSAIYGRCTSCHGAIHGSHEDRHLKK